MLTKINKYKQIQIIFTIILISLSITACGSQQSEKPITDTLWGWSEFIETEPASQFLVPDPENYTLQFSSDGTVSIKADCNMASGSYTLDGSSLAIVQGPTTMAYCGEESLDLLYQQSLGKVESYTIEDGQLVLKFNDGAGQMTFIEK